MAITLTKGLIGLGGLGSIAGGSVLAWQKGVFSSSIKSVKDKLLSNGYEILDANSGHWTEIFKTYKDAKNTKWKFERDEITSSSQDSEIQKLKDKCQEALSLRSYDDQNYYNAVKWCVVPKKVESFIDKKSLLNTAENNQDTQKWQQVLTKYKTSKKGGAGKYAMDGVELEDDAGNTKDESNRKKIIEGCKSRREKYHYSLDFESVLQEVKTWCTEEATK
ncbi:hypothetical protein MHC_04975 [Mycoplasma haemocanis str. Illinois]|uniref:Uncharacterized protein n=1 Tax=Mycoplasma haemocanis (strain Illinois) TaxID=1111676 RepID=H6N879_MYCHN|nr:hypothetical protein [Mycoplasma haemocanis]AEW45851.1 hypothetical protein MHC_04975 [Mycoplasma haemocanis str. Illinois]